MKNLTDNEVKFDLQLFAEGDGGDGDGEGAGEEGEDKSFFPDGFPRWTAALPKELQKDERVKGFNTIGEMAYSYLGLQEKQKNIPQAPENADDYELPQPDEKELKTDADTEKWYRKLAHKLGIPKKMAEQLYSETNKRAIDLLKKQVKVKADTAGKHNEMIRGEWGTEHDGNMKLAEKGIAELGGDDLETLLTESGLRNHPVILKAFKQIGFEHSDDTLRSGTISGEPGERTLDDEYPSMKDLPDRR